MYALFVGYLLFQFAYGLVGSFVDEIHSFSHHVDAQAKVSCDTNVKQVLVYLVFGYWLFARLTC